MNYACLCFKFWALMNEGIALWYRRFVLHIVSTKTFLFRVFIVFELLGNRNWNLGSLIILSENRAEFIWNLSSSFIMRSFFSPSIYERSFGPMIRSVILAWIRSSLFRLDFVNPLDQSGDANSIPDRTKRKHLIGLEQMW